MSALENTEAKMTRAKRNGHGNKFSKRLALAVKAEREAIELSDDISTLAEWLRRDILAWAGDAFNCRRELMDFVIEALEQREHLRPHRIRPVRVMLENQRDLLHAENPPLIPEAPVSEWISPFQPVAWRRRRSVSCRYFRPSFYP